jgi:cobalamin biosynthesis Mg chelatase CobN
LPPEKRGEIADRAKKGGKVSAAQELMKERRGQREADLAQRARRDAEIERARRRLQWAAPAELSASFGGGLSPPGRSGSPARRRAGLSSGRAVLSIAIGRTRRTRPHRPRSARQR